MSSEDEGAATVSPSKLTFSTSNYNTAQTVTVSAEDDADGRDESVTVSNEADGGGYDDVSENYTASVTDDDRALTVSALSGLTEGSNTTKTYTVKLAAKPAASVTVAVTSGDTEAATVSPSKLTFSTSSWNTNQAVTVSPVDDDDGENETVTITNTADAGYGSVTKNVTASVTDDDTKELTFSPTSVTVVEESTAKYTVKLATLPTNNVTVAVASGDTDIATVSPSKLTFSTSNYNTAQTVTVTGADDDDGKDESTTVAHTSSGGGYGSVSADYTAKVTDNDRALTVSALSGLTEGSNTTKTYTVKLAAEPAASVTVAVASGDTEAATVSPSKLTFSTSDYNTAQTVTVSPVDDADGENESVAITNTADSGYGSETASVTATVTDDDTKGLTLSPTSGTVQREAQRSTR